jgi:hypothetical protein
MKRFLLAAVAACVLVLGFGHDAGALPFSSSVFNNANGGDGYQNYPGGWRPADHWRLQRRR